MVYTHATKFWPLSVLSTSVRSLLAVEEWLGESASFSCTWGKESYKHRFRLCIQVLERNMWGHIMWLKRMVTWHWGQKIHQSSEYISLQNILLFCHVGLSPPDPFKLSEAILSRTLKSHAVQSTSVTMDGSCNQQTQQKCSLADLIMPRLNMMVQLEADGFGRNETVHGIGLLILYWEIYHLYYIV